MKKSRHNLVMSKLMEEFLGNLRDKKIMARVVIKSILNYLIFSIYFLKIFLHKKTHLNKTIASEIQMKFFKKQVYCC